MSRGGVGARAQPGQDGGFLLLERLDAHASRRPPQLEHVGQGRLVALQVRGGHLGARTASRHVRALGRAIDIARSTSCKAAPVLMTQSGAPFLWLDNDSLSILYTYVDLPFALRLTCRQLRDAHPGPTKSCYRDVVSSEAMVSWAIDNGAAQHAGGALAEAAAAAGNLPVLQYVHIFTNLVMKRNLTEAAATHGHLPVLRWLRERECPWDEAAACEAAVRGHIHILQYTLDNNAPEGTEPLIQKAARHGRMECVRWLHIVRHHDLTSSVYNAAAYGANLELLKWLDAKNPKLGTKDASISAADSGNIECLQYVQRRHGWSPIDCAIGAVENNHLAVLEWMVKFPAGRKAMRWSTPEEGSLLGKAAFYGYVKIMALLVEHGAVLNEGVAIDATDGGSVAALKWLRERDCPWSYYVFVKAAGWPGSEKIMQWALDNGCPKGSGTDACCEAADNGALDNLQWLRANGFPWSEKVMIKAARGEHVSVLEWARANGCAWSARVTLAAAQHNSPDALLWLLKAGCPYNVEELLGAPPVWAVWARRSKLRMIVTRLEKLDQLATASPSLFNLEERWQLLEASDPEWERAVARFQPSPALP